MRKVCKSCLFMKRLEKDTKPGHVCIIPLKYGEGCVDKVTLNYSCELYQNKDDEYNTLYNVR